MEAIKVAVVTYIARHDDPAVRDGVEALQHQIDADFGPVWRVSAHLDVIGNDQLEQHRPHHWGLVVYDDSTPRDQLDRYGDLTHRGLPLAKAYVPPGVPWTLPASQALLQMLANPFGDLAIYDEADPQTSRFIAVRVCDPVHSEQDAYQVNVDSGTPWLVSNFVYPSWFRAHSPERARHDRQGRLREPHQLSPAGGRAYFFEVSSGRWQVRSIGPGQTMPAVLWKPDEEREGSYPPP